MGITFNLKFYQVKEGFIGFVDELPGANSQGNTFEETKSNLLEAIDLTLEANRYLNPDPVGEFYKSEQLQLVAV